MVVDITKEYQSCLKDEIADVFIYLLAICDLYHIVLFETFKDKEKINLSRMWK